MPGSKPAPRAWRPTRPAARGRRRPTNYWPVTAAGGERWTPMAERGGTNREIIAGAGQAGQAKEPAERRIPGIEANRVRVEICLSGGSSPKQMFELLATDAYRRRIAWDR